MLSVIFFYKQPEVLASHAHLHTGLPHSEAAAVFYLSPLTKWELQAGFNFLLLLTCFSAVIAHSSSSIHGSISLVAETWNVLFGDMTIYTWYKHLTFPSRRFFPDLPPVGIGKTFWVYLPLNSSRPYVEGFAADVILKWCFRGIKHSVLFQAFLHRIYILLWPSWWSLV